MRRFVLILSAWLSISASPSAATTWFVDQGGNGDFTTIQDAINAASSGDEIVVLPGVYQENIDFLGKDLWLHSEQGPANTVIDGSQAADDNRSCVRFQSGEGSGAVLEGFRITGGQGTLYQGSFVGGGVFCLDSSPRIVSRVFEMNEAEYAGAIYINNGSPEIVGCEFNENTSQTYGGAIAGSNVSPVSITNCSFYGNTALSGDGTIHLADSATIEDCVFVGNTARAGAAINSPSSGANFLIRNCIFQENIAIGTNGGAIRIHEANAVIQWCVFDSNHAGSHGGAIALIDGATGTVEHCTFYGNTAPEGGHIALYNLANLDAQNNIFAYAAYGAGVSCLESTASFQCNDAWMNTGGNYVGSCPDPTGTNGNISEDPLFCEPELGDFTLRSDSPCAPQNNQECGLIGARDIGCSPPTPVAELSWGRVKALFRSEQ
jgi:predicted outer membrane repeat protein